MEQKPKRKYPKKMKLEEAYYHAIVILKDCAGLSFISITRLIGLKDSSKRNVEYYYKRYKDQVKCQCINCVALQKEVKVSGGTIISGIK